jgi:hypothetical protein
MNLLISGGGQDARMGSLPAEHVRAINTRPNVKPKSGPNFKILDTRSILKTRPNYYIIRTNIYYPLYG